MRYNDFSFRPLFSYRDLQEVLQARERDALSYIRLMEESDVANLDVAIAEAQERARKAGVEVLSVEKPTIGEGRRTDEVEAVVVVKIGGDIKVVNCKPTTFEPAGGPPAEVENDTVVFAKMFPATVDPDQVGEWRDGMVAALKRWIGYANKDIDAYNAEVGGRIAAAVRARADQLSNIKRLNETL